MKKLLFIVTLLIILAVLAMSCSSKNENKDVSSNIPKLENDFYENINYSLLQSWQIPDDKARYNIFSVIDDRNKDIINNIVLEEYNKRPDKTNLDSYNISAMYETSRDFEVRNKSGYGAVNSVISSIDSALSISELLKISNDFGKKYGINILTIIGITTDLVDSDKYKLYYDTAYGILKENWFAENQLQASSYKEYLEKLWVENGTDEAAAKEIVDNVTKMMKSIAEVSLSIEDSQNPSLVYNLKTLTEIEGYFNKKYSADDIKSLYSITDDAETFMVFNVKSAEKMAEYLVDENLDLIKNYMKSNIYFHLGNYTSENSVKAYAEYYKKINGLKEYGEDKVLEKNISDSMAYEIGRIYTAKYFSNEVKENIVKIIDEVKKIYEKRLNNIAWLGSETKQRALIKLQMMKTVAGYDETKQWPQDIFKYTLKNKAEGGIYIDNVLEIAVKENEYYFNEMVNNNPVNKNIHDLPPQTVNAFYSPVTNSITILAGILQEPLYSISYTDEEKIGGIGTVIAHEITHAFDSNGAMFDENGNYVNWWQQSDMDNFTKLTSKVVDYYNGFEMENNKINGKLTLSENIADLGAVSCITEYAKNNNYDLKKVYSSYGRMWAEKIRPEALINQILTDVHSPAKIRVNAVLSATDDFYEAYNIKEGDGMFKTKESRPAVW